MAIYYPPSIYSKIIPILAFSPPPPSPAQYQYQTISNANPPPWTNPSPITTYFSPPPPPLITTSPPPPLPTYGSPSLPTLSPPPPLPTYGSPSLPTPSPPPPPPSPPLISALWSSPPPVPIAPVSSPPPTPAWWSLPPPVPIAPVNSPPPTPALWSAPPPAPIAPVIPPPPPPTLPSSPPSTSSCPPPLPAPALPSPPPPDIASVFSSPPSPSLPSPPPPPPPTAMSPPTPHLATPPLMEPQLPSTTLPESPPALPIFPPPLLKPRVPTTTSPLPLPLPLPSPAQPHHSNANNFNVSGNLGLKNGPSRNNGAMSGATTTIAVLAGLMMLSFVGVGIWFVRQRKRVPSSGVDMPPFGGFSVMPELSYSRTPSFPLVRHGSGSYRFAYSPSNPGLPNSRSFFSFEDLTFVTNGFSAQNLLAEGGFGPVYKGCLQDGREVAVKQLKVGGSQGEREFRAEVEIISRVHHRHLVSLVGYCILEHQRLLVYDYVPNRTLYYHLHGQERPVMDWTTRVKVAIGAARGIAYLHEDCQPRIIHRDIKSSNILLDNNFEAQVSDFGLAKLVPDACTHVSTRVMGTFGYLAPEYASSGKLTEKSDVYSFGVVLLELVTGRKPVDASQHLGDESLVEWARPLLSHALETGEVGELPDPRLDRKYTHHDMFRMIEASAACVRRSATMRPRMGQVVRALGNLVDSDLTSGVRPGLSEVFNTGPNTEEIELFQRTRFTCQEYDSSDFR